ncbi:sodium/glutamate symporter [Cloacibacillus evryensis]|uniref:sodium/glutamate symporter n=1 Tax=Cloacibacillus evryensis TaxID=508460 RepID=UPI00370CFC0D
MSDIFVVKMDFIQTMAFAAILYWLGVTLCRRVKFLIRYNIPPAVAGGLLFALLRLLAASRVGFEFDLTLMEPFMIAFFTTIGLGASVALLRRGGRAAFRLLLAACLLLVLQNAAAIMIGKLSGLDPLLSVLAGSATMTGGHGTGLVFADEFEKVLGLQGAQAAAIACATFGVLAGSLLGGPIAERLIKGRSLANEANIGENYRKEMIPDVFSFGDTGEEINTHSILMAVFQITFAVGLGMWFSEWLGARGILLPAYAIALVAGMAIRNAGDHARLLRVNPRIVKHISGACLSFFLAFALMSVDLTALAGLAAPLISILAVQVVLMILFAFYVTFRLTGGDYQAAVITAGHAGFGLGATPNAIANMEAVCAKYGMAPDAFFAVAAVGAFFIDIVNVVVINVLVKLFA